MNTPSHHLPWGDDAAQLFSPEQRRLMRKVRRGQLSGEELIAYFDSDSIPVSGTLHFTKFTPAPIKLFVPSRHDGLAGGVVGIPTKSDPQSDPVASASGPRTWVTGANLPNESPEPEAADVLAGLRSDRDADARTAVFDSEGIDFSQQSAVYLVPLLRRYIDRHRQTSARDAMVATATAIRGYIAYLPADELEATAELLARNDMPSALENETVKMVVQKLTAVPPGRDEQFPKLADQVAGLATSYTVPRLINREYYGPTALNAVLATAMLRTSRWAATFSQVAALPDRGFRRQVGKWAGGVLATPRTTPLPTVVALALESLTKLVD